MDDPWLKALQELADSGALAWLKADDILLFARHGLGIVLTRAQEKALRRILADPDSGLFHVLRWGNRGGKTTLLVVLHLYCIWKKWRYQADTFDTWLRYNYRTLHTAPTNKLAGKAWSLCDAIVKGIADQQQDPRTKAYRPAPLARFFEAGKSTAKDGTDELWVKCSNGARIDFLSTQGGAPRVEGDTWWVISWDEFARQQPVTDVILLIDQTFLPRSSDHMAPVILTGTSTEDFDVVYEEIQERAEKDPRRWVFSEERRDSNFSQTRASIERQRAMSFDPAAINRSLDGGVGEGGRGPFPRFLLDNAFTDDLPAITPRISLPDDHVVLQSFDHSLRADNNVLLSVAAKWPMMPDELIREPIFGVNLDVRRGTRSLLPDEQFAMMERGYLAYEPLVRADIIDATAEGGLMVFRQARARGLPAVDCSFTARTPGSIRISNKEYGIQALQRLLAWGLDVRFGDDGWVEDWPEPDPERPFGLLRFPNQLGQWAKARRQLAVYRRDDKLLTQDIAMAMVMLAWYIYRLIDQGSKTHVQRISMTRGYGPRTRTARRLTAVR